MTLETLIHFPLSGAYLCEDCHCVGNCSERCASCASDSLLMLAVVLNRETESELEAVTC
jgi:hypothetical protein